MIQLLGFFFVLIGAYGLNQQINGVSLGQCALGVFLAYSKEIFGHLFFIEREKVSAQYRRQK
jgi:hypothetical protein